MKYYLTIILLLLTTWSFAGTLQSGTFSMLDFLSSPQMTIAATIWLSTQLINITHFKGWPARLISWGMGFVLIALARFVFDIQWVIELGSMYYVFEKGLSIALIANGVHTIPQIKTSAQKVTIKKKPII